MPKSIDDGFDPVRERRDEVEALAVSDNPAASFAQAVLDYIAPSEPVQSEPDTPTPSSTSNDTTEQLAGVFDF